MGFIRLFYPIYMIKIAGLGKRVRSDYLDIKFACGRHINPPG
jgi:hypothetical protein